MRLASLVLGVLALAVVAFLFFDRPAPPTELPLAAVGEETDVPEPAEEDGLIAASKRPERPRVDAASIASSDAEDVTEDGASTVTGAPRRIDVVDVRGEPLPGAVAIFENQGGNLIGLSADEQGRIEIPTVLGVDVVTVSAEGYVPEVLNGIRQEERVALAAAIRVDVEFTDGWQRLTEGWAGTTLEGGFEARLVPPKAPGTGLDSGEPRRVAVHTADGSVNSVELATLEAALRSPITPRGLAKFRVAEPGEYGVEVKVTLKRPEKPDNDLLLTIDVESGVVVRSDGSDQYFQRQVPTETIDRNRSVFARGLGD